MIGKKVERLTIQQKTESNDANGELSASWATFVTRWGSVVSAGASEDNEGAERLEPRQSWRVFLWLDTSTVKINPTMRISWGTRYLEIVAAAPDESRREIILDCVEHISGLQTAATAGA